MRLAGPSLPSPPLPDRVHAAIPRVTCARWMVHAIPVVMLVTSSACLGARHTLRLLQIYAALLIVRALAFWSTLLPAPRCDCVPYQLCGVQLGGCSDMMFSGHTTLMMLCWLFLAWYHPGAWWGVPLVAGTAVAFSIALVIATRHHYTTDVVMAVAISTLAFAGFGRDRPLK